MTAAADRCKNRLTLPEQGVLINVCGAAQSGTTMMHLMLGNGRRAFACGEVYAKYRPHDPGHHQIRCHCGKSPCPAWRKLDGVPEEQFHRTVIETFRRNTVVDSSKVIDWVSDSNSWGPETGLRVENVLMWKEPQSLAYSWWRRGWLNIDRVEATGRKNPLPPEKLIEYYERFFETGLPYVAVNYENLIETPARTLAGLSHTLGLPYRRGQQRYWNKTHHYVFGSGTVSRALKRDRSKIVKQELPDEYFESAGAYLDALHSSEAAQKVFRTLEKNDIRHHIDAEAA